MNRNGFDRSIFKTIFEYIVNFKNDKYNLYFIEKIITQQLFFYSSYNTNHIDFLVNNYDLIKSDNKLDILFDAYMFKYFKMGCSSSDNNSTNIFYINNYISFNYVYKIYINCVNKIVETNLENKEVLDESLIDLKTIFINTEQRRVDGQNHQLPLRRFYISHIKETHMYKILSILNKKIDEKNDIFRNFDKKYASYYPIEIITLYNFYMHD
jgi:hypothetical protein